MPQQSPWLGVPAAEVPQGPITGRHGLPLQTAQPQGWLGKNTGAKSDMMMKLGRALMGFSEGLGTGKGWSEGLARGTARGTEAFLSEGRRQRAESARSRFSNLAEKGGPNADIYGLMASLEPGQMIPLAQQMMAQGGKASWQAKADYGSGLIEGRTKRTEGRRAGQQSEQQRQRVELFRRALYDSGARDQLIQMKLMGEAWRTRDRLPQKMMDAIQDDNKRSQQQQFMGDIFAEIRNPDPNATPNLTPDAGGVPVRGSESKPGLMSKIGLGNLFGNQ